MFSFFVLFDLCKFSFFFVFKSYWIYSTSPTCCILQIWFPLLCSLHFNQKHDWWISFPILLQKQHFWVHNQIYIIHILNNKKRDLRLLLKTQKRWKVGCLEGFKLFENIIQGRKFCATFNMWSTFLKTFQPDILYFPWS